MHKGLESQGRKAVPLNRYGLLLYCGGKAGLGRCMCFAGLQVLSHLGLTLSPCSFSSVLMMAGA